MRAGCPGPLRGETVLHKHGFDWRRLCATRPARRLERRAGVQREAVADARRNNVKRSDNSRAPVEHSDGAHRAERASLLGEPVRSGMSPSSNETGRADPPDPGSEQRLLNRVRRGSASAVGGLLERYTPWMRRRASGRLPQWARSAIATSDLVQDVLHHAFARLKWFESKHVSALRAYLRRARERVLASGPPCGKPSGSGHVNVIRE